MVGQSIFQAVVVTVGVSATVLCSLLYFQRVRLDRPPVGTFNGRDVAVLMVFIVLLPVLYLVLPGMVLTGFLVVTFVSALYICLRPLVRPRFVWAAIALMLVTNIVVTETQLGTRTGWQVYWLLTSLIVLVAAVGVSNLYVQGGMRLRHVAWFALLLACYDAFFSLVVPLTPKLADAFEGRPLDPAIGFVMGPWTANIGLGDLLLYCLFMAAAYRAFGRRGAWTALAVIIPFGAIAPSLAPLAISRFVRGGIGVVVPAQVFFGPVAFLAFVWLSRHHVERTPAQWLAERRIAPPQRARASTRRDAVRREPVVVPRAAAVDEVPVPDLAIG
jgi:hypothetical protein